VSEESRPKISHTRITGGAWLGAVLVHALIVVGLQFTTMPAQSNIAPSPTMEAVRIQAADARELQRRRDAYQRALREAEAARAEAERLAAEKTRKQEEKRKAAAAEKKRKAAEKRKREEEKRKAAEAEKKRKAEEKRRREAEAKRKAAEAAAKKAKEELERAEKAAAERKQKQRLAEQREAEFRARQMDAWRIAIKERIERVWIQPPTVSRKSCEVVVSQNEEGKVLSAKIRDCDASEAWQESLRSAVMRASPLPEAPSDMFRSKVIMTFYPGE